MGDWLDLFSLKLGLCLSASSFPETPIVGPSLLEQLGTYFDDAADCLVCGLS